MQVVLNRREKEKLVIKLYQEGKTYRAIAHEAHLSFGDIGSIIRKTDGRESEDEIAGIKDIKNKSKDTQALFLFSCGKKPIEVAVELDLTASQVHDIQEEYWALIDLHELTLVYNEVKAFQPSFLQLFPLFKKE
jgi:hypothetical protein